MLYLKLCGMREHWVSKGDNSHMGKSEACVRTNSVTEERPMGGGSFHRTGHKLKNADGVDSSIMLS